ncbi:MAG: YidC/Oxa1 family membrane protein insertase [Saccharofermentanaceae bacterium]|nr:YidC/Oxa1 family membrane protein insertase [Saccharofermentanaceae bacterium]
MSFPQLLYQLLIAPLELIFECIFSVTYGIVGNVGLSIIPLSLIMNFLVLPFYNRADQIQKEQHDQEEKLAPGIEHLKKTFKGDKRFMVLQTFYRQNHYSPIHALRSSFAVLLEIPFFMAAYHFLSNYKSLNGATLGPLTDLGKPDQLLTLFGYSINLLPILMTLINIVSCRIYAKGLSKKDEIRMYAIALVFLVLLYRSPSGLVFYWTLNQVFSLIKNAVKASKNKKTAIDLILILLSMCTLLYTVLGYRGSSANMALLFIISLLPLLILLKDHSQPQEKKVEKKVEKKEEKNKKAAPSVPYGKIFFFSSLFLSLLTGLLIPSSVIRSSPSEFIIFTDYTSPVNYIILVFALAFGLLVIWCGLFYYLSTAKARRVFSITMCILAFCALVNYFLSGRHLSFLKTSLIFDGDLFFPALETILDIVIIFALIGLIALLWKKHSGILTVILFTGCCGCAFLGIYNSVHISSAMKPVKEILDRENSRKASFTFSKEGKNVVVLMMDRAISAYVPYLFNEDPALASQFDGFTWYPNALSFGGTTNIGTPALFGGYEYQPVNMNARNDLPLKDKQNEALRVMPVLFDESGFDVTVCDPPYAGYSTPPDLTIYNDHPDIDAYLTQYGQYWDHPQNHKRQEHIWTRNFFCYGFSRIMPLPSQYLFYDDGKYHDPNWINDSIYQTQYLGGLHTAVGINANFMGAYSFLQAMPDSTKISDGGENTFLMINNCTTHDVALLQEPEYKPAVNVDNTQFDQEHSDRFTLNGQTLKMDAFGQLAHYQSNMAAFRELGKWFDYLRAEGVWDNTRIIIVSDHGFYLEHMEERILGHKYTDKINQNPEDTMAYNAFLMVKDFNSTGFKTDYTFMTNADTPVLAFEDLVADPVNPATGNPINSDPKFDEKLYVFYTLDWRPSTNNGNSFSKGIWFSLKNQDIFDLENWKEEGIW